MLKSPLAERLSRDPALTNRPPNQGNSVHRRGVGRAHAKSRDHMAGFRAPYWAVPGLQDYRGGRVPAGGGIPRGDRDTARTGSLRHGTRSPQSVLGSTRRQRRLAVHKPLNVLRWGTDWNLRHGRDTWKLRGHTQDHTGRPCGERSLVSKVRQRSWHRRYPDDRHERVLHANTRQPSVRLPCGSRRNVGLPTGITLSMPSWAIQTHSR